MKTKIKIALFSSLLLAPLLMWLLPTGSFDPRNWGFWWSIFMALGTQVVVMVLVPYILNKFRQQ